MTADELALLRSRFDAARLSEELGLRCRDLRPGMARVTMEVAPELRHPSGAVPGVFLGGLGEQAAELARAAAGRPGAPVAMTMRFVRGAFGERVHARAEVVDASVVSVRLRDDDRRVCATALVTWPAA